MQSIGKVVDIPAVAQREILVVRAIQKTIAIPHYIDKVVDVPRGAGRAGSTGAGRGEDNRNCRSLENR